MLPLPTEKRFTVVHNSKPVYSSDEYEDGSLDYKGKDIEFKNVVYFNSCPPEKPLQLFPNTEIVYHACDWDKNFLDNEKTANLIEFLKENESDVNFSFISGLLNG